MKLLLAEDTRDLSRALVAMLEHDGYQVDPVYDGQEAVDHITKDSYDGIILDIMMPRKTGMEVLAELRAMNITTPVLFLTAKTELDDKVNGLEAGADDYLTKPFAMRELIARVHSMTRRKTEYAAKELKIGTVTLDPEKFELASENSVRLSVKEFELMQTLMLSEGRPQTTDYLFERVWGGEKDRGATPEVVFIYISYLRNKLRSIAADIAIDGERGGSYTLVRSAGI